MFGMFDNDFNGGYNNPGDMFPSSQGQGQGQDKKPGSRPIQVIIPSTVSMILNADYLVSDDSFKFGSYQMQQLMVVGIIREVVDATINIAFKIDDGTHPDFLVARFWLSDKNAAQKDKLSLCREDMFVRVTGLLKSAPENGRTLMIFDIQPITNYNEITFHLLNTIHSYLYQTKVVSKGDNNTNNPFGVLTTNHNSLTTSRHDASSSTNMNSSGLNGHRKTVYDVIYKEKINGGTGINDIKNKLPNVSESEIRSAVEFLSGEGHIYCTIDNDHFNITE